jgi:hypothetical protein
MTCASPQIPPSDDASTPRHNGLGLGEGYGMKGGGRQRDGAIKNTAGKLKDEGLSTNLSGSSDSFAEGPMEQAAVALEAIGESIVFLDHFKGLPDPRQRGKITYPLGEVLLLCLLAVLGGAETFVDIARFGDED